MSAVCSMPMHCLTCLKKSSLMSLLQLKALGSICILFHLFDRQSYLRGSAGERGSEAAAGAAGTAE